MLGEELAQPVRVRVRLDTGRDVVGPVLPGESLYAAALRLGDEAQVRLGQPDAVDLSGAEKLFDVGGGATIGFRPLSRADLPVVVRWLRQPHVNRWWHDETPNLATAERQYGPAIDGTEPTRVWVAEVNGRSVGFVQEYRIGDHPEYAILTGAPDAIGLDYVVGEPAWVGRGVGTRMLWRLLRDVVWPHRSEATTYFAAPDHRNAASLRVLEKLGFQRGLWFDEPQPDGRVDTVVSCTFDVRRVLGGPY